ncbi:hypothetical protein KFE98_20645 [bacterium SCSIO 12741]|nr:hypothetical protein KFE98_20645 [bacterium SCSIO 12741]
MIRGLLLLAGIIHFTVGYSTNLTQLNRDSTWFIEINSRDIGVVQTVMEFHFLDSTFTAFSRPNADRDIIGYWPSLGGRLLTSDFKNGSLLRISKGKFIQRGDTIHLAGLFISALGHYAFRGTLSNDRLEGEWRDRRKKLRGTMIGKRQRVELPLANYSSLFEESRSKALEKLYDPKLTEKKEWRTFEKKMQRTSLKVQDDLEMVFAFYYYARKLPFSHFSLMKTGNQESEEEEPSRLDFDEKSAKTAYLNIRSFDGSAEEMDSILMKIIEGGYQNLIVDLRENPGGTVEAGLTFANRMVDSSYYGGVFLTRKWFEKHEQVPSQSDYTLLPEFSEANFDLIIQGIHEKEGLCLRLTPEKKTFQGNLYLLTSKRTASTCEPLVYGLKQFGRAQVVGETTAGAMLNGEIFPLSSGFSLVIPTATYYTSDGFKIDGQGVNPNHVVKADEALNYVLNQLISNP